MATIVDNIRKDVERITKQFIRASMPEPKMLHAEICWNLSTIEYTWDWTKHTVASGLEKDFIKALEMEVCKKSEAHVLLLVGEQIDGCFIGSKTKRYWLKPVVR
jgi:hypothetical protein